jgi:hypothetical protein
MTGKPTKDAIFINNVIFILLDIIEGLMKDAEKEFRSSGCELKHTSKQNFNKTIFHLKKFLEEVRHIPIDQQENFGDEADILKELIFYAVDRDNNTEYVKKLIEVIKLNKSVHNFDFKKIGV